MGDLSRPFMGLSTKLVVSRCYTARTITSRSHLDIHNHRFAFRTLAYRDAVLTTVVYYAAPLYECCHFSECTIPA